MNKLGLYPQRAYGKMESLSYHPLVRTSNNASQTPDCSSYCISNGTDRVTVWSYGEDVHKTSCDYPVSAAGVVASQLHLKPKFSHTFSKVQFSATGCSSVACNLSTIGISIATTSSSGLALVPSTSNEGPEHAWVVTKMPPMAERRDSDRSRVTSRPNRGLHSLLPENTSEKAKWASLTLEASSDSNVCAWKKVDKDEISLFRPSRFCLRFCRLYPGMITNTNWSTEPV